jgi:hypothetical protein
MAAVNGKRNGGGQLVKLIRDLVAILVAVGLVANEILTPGPTDPVAIGAVLVLLTGAAAFRIDERR